MIKLENGKAIITGELQVSTLDIGGTNVTASANDINKLTGVTTTSQQLGYLSDVTSAVQSQIDSKLSSATAALTYSAKVGNSDLVTVGALDSGSITSGFGSII